MTDSHKSHDARSTEHSGPHRPSADAQTPLFLYQQTFKSEAHKVLDESAAAMEKTFQQWEKGMGEMNKLMVAQAKLVQEQTRSFMDGVRAMMR